jgi:hypothetical protein
MTDQLIERSRLVLQENRRLRMERIALEVACEMQRERLRVAVLENAMCRTEIKALREDGR